MNDSGESPKETADRKMKVLSAKWKTRIGFWNLKTIYEKGKPVKSKADVRRYNLHFLGISVSRWAGLGRHNPTQERQCYIPEQMTSTIRD